MKYIVYCTTNLINNKIYIGQHLVKDPNIFDGYLGCGCYIQHISSYKNPKTSFQRAIKKYGIENFKREIIDVFDSLEDALKLESELVNDDFLKRNDVYNEVLGGKVGDTTVSIKCYQYDLEGNFIAEYRSQQQASYAVNKSFSTIKSAIKNKVKSANSFWSLEKVEKLDLTKFKTDNNRKRVYQYNLNGEYEKEYNSVSEAAKALSSTSTNISRSCKTNTKCKGKLLSYQLNNIYIPVINNIDIENIKIYQYDLNGNFINEFNSYKEVLKVFDKQNGLVKAIKLNKTYCGYQWKTEKLDKIKSYIIRGKPRKVAQYDKFGKLVKVYNTVSECSKYFSGCKRVLSGDYKTSGGYIFKYVN